MLKVKYEGKTYFVQAQVARGVPSSVMGRNWLSKIHLDWKLWFPISKLGLLEGNELTIAESVSILPT